MQTNRYFEEFVPRDAIRRAVAAAYDQVGREGAHAPGGLAVPTGPALARALGYGEALLADLPEEVAAAFVGAAALAPRVAGGPGQVAVDLGCGAGLDALALARRGLRVWAVDASAPMLARLASGIRAAGVAGVFPVRARLPQVPLSTGSADWLLLNGVANLVPERSALLAEARRLLGPGGRLLAADLVTLAPLPAELVDLPEAWAWCLGGAVSPSEWEASLAAAGFASPRVELLEEIWPVARAVVTATPR